MSRSSLWNCCMALKQSVLKIQIFKDTNNTTCVSNVTTRLQSLWAKRSNFDSLFILVLSLFLLLHPLLPVIDHQMIINTPGDNCIKRIQFCRPFCPGCPISLSPEMFTPWRLVSDLRVVPYCGARWLLEDCSHWWVVAPPTTLTKKTSYISSNVHLSFLSYKHAHREYILRFLNCPLCYFSRLITLITSYLIIWMITSCLIIWMITSCLIIWIV